MATITGATYNEAVQSIATNPEKYSAIGELLNAAASGVNELGKPDVSELLVETYGDQGITGFLKLTGAVSSAGASDQVEFYEVGRRHRRLNYNSSGFSVVTGTTPDILVITQANLEIEDGTTDVGSADFEKGDIFLEPETGVRLVYRGLDADSQTGHTFARLDGTNVVIGDVDNTNGGTLIHIGNMYSQGSEQPANFMEPNVKRRINSYAIVKDRFQVNGSQATNVGYVNIGNGDYRWFMYGEQEARKRFEDRREMILLFGEQNAGVNIVETTANTTGKNSNFAGTEGYITALQDRGIQVAGEMQALADFDALIAELDANGAVSEYAMYVNRSQDLAIDDMLASGVATQVTAGLPGQFGAFNNDADMAVKLGFKSFTRGGYTFHKHDFKLLNDPSLLGAPNSGKFKGVMCPLTSVADARTGVSAPALEMKYKASNGYSREMEHWVTGGGIMGHTNGDAGRDVMTFHYRSEVCLLTRAANQHVLIRS
jgi:hypothetical protein